MKPTGILKQMIEAKSDEFWRFMAWAQAQEETRDMGKALEIWQALNNDDNESEFQSIQGVQIN